MASKEKQVSYQTTNTYSIKNQLTAETKNIWLCCHGLGFLSRYFIQYFNALDKDENYVIAPQAQSKYYQKSDFKHVGASWLTKENTKAETKNVLSYLDAIYAEEIDASAKNFILFGFSQGVSVSMRWMASRKIDCDMLVIYAGGIPKELTPDDFAFVKNTKVKLVYGTQDQYITAERIEQESKFAKSLFGDRLEIIPFDGKHELKPQLIKDLVG